jgi:hypothetical protein
MFPRVVSSKHVLSMSEVLCVETTDAGRQGPMMLAHDPQTSNRTSPAHSFKTLGFFRRLRIEDLLMQHELWNLCTHSRICTHR